METLFEIPNHPKLWVAVLQITPHSDFEPFIDWESVSFSQESCEEYAAQWHEDDDVIICEFSPSLVPVKEIVSEYTRSQPVEVEEAEESCQRSLFT